MFILEFGILKSAMNRKLIGLTTYKTIMFQTSFWYVPNLVIEVTEMKKKSSMVRPGSSAWRSLRTMNIFMFADDSSLEVSFLQHKEMLLVLAAAVHCCHTGQFYQFLVC